MEQENLYNSLCYNIPKDASGKVVDLSDTQKTYLSEIIPTLDLSKKEVLYMLMLHDYSLENPNSKVIYPFKSKQITLDTIEIKIDCLSNKMKQILYRFVKLAQEAIKKDAEHANA